MMPEQQLPHQALHQSVLLREVVAALSPADNAWVEEAISKEVARGQLVRGNSEWASPAFPTKDEGPEHKRKRKNPGFTFYIPKMYSPLFDKYINQLETIKKSQVS